MTRNQSILIIFLQIILLSIIQITIAEEQIDLAGIACKFSANVSTNGTYQTNIDSLFSVLTAQSLKTKFFTTSSGAGEDRVNGLLMCRPDISLETCHSCIKSAIVERNRYCSGRKESIIWFDECMLRYSNRTVASTYQNRPFVGHWGIFKVSRPDIFPSLLNNNLGKIITDASMPENKERFAYGNSNFTQFEGFYGLAWCTPDITPKQCNHCLRAALSRVPKCCAGGLGQSTKVLLPSCILRYDVAPFLLTVSPTTISA